MTTRFCLVILIFFLAPPEADAAFRLLPVPVPVMRASTPANWLADSSMDDFSPPDAAAAEAADLRVRFPAIVDLINYSRNEEILVAIGCNALALQKSVGADGPIYAYDV